MGHCMKLGWYMLYFRGRKLSSAPLLAKQWDLRTLSKYLPPPITPEQIDGWYPEPTAQIGDLEDDDSDGSISDTNC